MAEGGAGGGGGGRGADIRDDTVVVFEPTGIRIQEQLGKMEHYHLLMLAFEFANFSVFCFHLLLLV